MSRINNKTPEKFGRFFEFLKGNFLYIIGGILLLIIFLPWMSRIIAIQKLKNLESEFENEERKDNFENSLANPKIIAEKSKALKNKYPLVNKAKWEELNTNALRMAIALGTSVKQDKHNGWFGYYTLSGLTEDEEEAVKIAKKHTGTFPILADLYFSVYTRSRNLKNDLHSYLEKSQLQEIRAAHLKYGNFKHI